jgi:hypothetical protein
VRTFVRPWGTPGGGETWDRLYGAQELMRLKDGVRRFDPATLDGQPVSDRDGARFRIRVECRPVSGYIERFVEGFKVDAPSEHFLTAMDGGQAAAGFGIVRVDELTIRPLGGFSNPGYTKRGLWSRLVESALTRAPKGTRIQGIIGNNDTLVSLLRLPRLWRFVDGLPERERAELERISHEVGSISERFGRVDHARDSGEGTSESKLSYRDWQLMSKTLVAALESGISPDMQDLRGTLIPWIFWRAGYTDLRLRGVRTRRLDNGEDICLIEMRGQKSSSYP